MIEFDGPEEKETTTLFEDVEDWQPFQWFNYTYVKVPEFYIEQKKNAIKFNCISLIAQEFESIAYDAKVRLVNIHANITYK